MQSSHILMLCNRGEHTLTVPIKRVVCFKVLCIGAEGGWIDYEVDLLCQHGCTAISLGDRILRTESVVNVLLGKWLEV